MKVVLADVRHSDERRLDEIPTGEVVRDTVDLELDGRLHQFTVSIHVRIVDQLDASIMSGDADIEELFRHTPVVLYEIYRLVAAARRGKDLQLPQLIFEGHPPAADAASPGS